MSRYEVYLRELTRAERTKTTLRHVRVSVEEQMEEEIEQMFSAPRQIIAEYA
jgi:hypothetical protein